MKARLEQIQIVKVENGYVVTAAGKSFVSMDEDGVKELVTGELPNLLEVINKKEETKNGILTGRPESTTEVPNVR
jgi:hypothetical protein